MTGLTTRMQNALSRFASFHGFLRRNLTEGQDWEGGIFSEDGAASADAVLTVADDASLQGQLDRFNARPDRVHNEGVLTVEALREVAGVFREHGSLRTASTDQALTEEGGATIGDMVRGEQVTELPTVAAVVRDAIAEAGAALEPGSLASEIFGWLTSAAKVSGEAQDAASGATRKVETSMLDALTGALERRVLQLLEEGPRKAAARTESEADLAAFAVLFLGRRGRRKRAAPAPDRAEVGRVMTALVRDMSDRARLAFLEAAAAGGAAEGEAIRAAMIGDLGGMILYSLAPPSQAVPPAAPPAGRGFAPPRRGGGRGGGGRA
jgi:hypothetical protein